MEFLPRPYQAYTIDYAMRHPYCGLFLDMGLGKTVSALTVADRLLYEYLEVSKVLVVAPKRVAENVWTDEIAKWDHLSHLTTSLILGSESQRKKALKAKADIYIINRENVAWLVGLYQSAFPFDMVIIDELSSFKSSGSARFKALKLIRPKLKRVIGLTGTPASNGLIDLWAQLYLLDLGQRLGKLVVDFRDRFFKKKNYKYLPRKGASETIYRLIGDICISMKSEDYLDLPGVIERVIRINFDPEQQRKYDEFEEQRVLELLESGEVITAINANALMSKLQQYAGGAVYDNEAEKVWHEVNDAKLEALEELVESAGGEPVLVAYAFRHECERIMERLKRCNPVLLGGPQTIKDWNEKKIKVLVMHPASGGHGLNIQFGGHIIAWYGHTWNLELVQQLIKRLDRPGQTREVIVNRIVVKGTVDEDILRSNAAKEGIQNALLKAVDARVHKYQNKLKKKIA